MKKGQENPLRLLLCWTGPDRTWRILSAVSDLYRTAGVSRSGYYNGFIQLHLHGHLHHIPEHPACLLPTAIQTGLLTLLLFLPSACR